MTIFWSNYNGSDWRWIDGIEEMCGAANIRQHTSCVCPCYDTGRTEVSKVSLKLSDCNDFPQKLVLIVAYQVNTDNLFQKNRI